jgi:hypothetical protein
MSFQFTVQGQPVPVKSIDTIDHFYTPLWDEVLDQYPAWAKAVKESGQDPWPVQPFILGICKQLDGVDGRSEEAWARRMIGHFGLAWMEKRITECKAALEALERSCHER